MGSARSRTSIVGCGVLLAVLSYLAASLGSQNGQLALNWAWWGVHSSEMSGQIVWQWRVPRVLAAILTGACLSSAGLLLQTVTRNALADPYLIGVSGGAGLCVVVLSCVGVSSWWWTPAAAFVGALLAMRLVFGLTPRRSGRISMLSLVLTGVAINALCAALIALLVSRLDPFRLRVTATWLTGSIGFCTWPQLAVTLVLLAIVLLWVGRRTHQLNALALGETGARCVGVNVQQLSARALQWASLLAALSVAHAGLLGYLGLIVPHAVRRVVGLDLRHTLPLTTAGGALLLLCGDTLARTLFAPEELPVGVLMALIGCPALIVLLRRSMGRNSAT